VKRSQTHQFLAEQEAGRKTVCFLLHAPCFTTEVIMTVGVALVIFRLHEIRSLKDKRKIVKSLVERSRSRFNVSVAEVADQDVHQKASIGVAVIGNDGRVLNSLLDRIIDFMDSLGLADLVSREIELINI
jgi:hypothetical protein